MANTMFGSVLPIMPSLLKEYGFSTSGLSIPFLAIVFARIFVKFFCGKVLFLQYKWMCVISYALYILVFFLYCLYRTKLMFMGLRFLEGLAEGMLIVIFTDIAIHLSQKNNRGFYMGLFGMSFGIGMIIGPVYSGILYDKFGVDAIFLVNIYIACFGVLLSLFLEKYDIQKTEKLKLSIDLIRLLTKYLPAILRKVYFFTFAIFLPLYISQHLKMPVMYSSKLFAIIAFVLIIFGPISGRFVDKFSAQIVIIIGSVAMSIFSATIYFGGNFSVFFYLMLASLGFILPAGMKFFADLVKDHPNRTEILGISGTVAEIATIFVAIFVPFIMSINISYPWLFLSIFSLISITPFLKFNNK